MSGRSSDSFWNVPLQVHARMVANSRFVVRGIFGDISISVCCAGAESIHSYKPNFALTSSANDVHSKRRPVPLREQTHPSCFISLLPVPALSDCSHLLLCSCFLILFLPIAFSSAPPSRLSPAAPTSHLLHLLQQVVHRPRAPRRTSPLVHRWEAGLVGGRSEDDD